MADTKYIYGLGRRKAASARARLYKGKGEITINDKPALDYFSGNKSMLAEITDPLALTQNKRITTSQFASLAAASPAKLTPLSSQSLKLCKPKPQTCAPSSKKPARSSATRAKKNAKNTVSAPPAKKSNSASVNGDNRKIPPTGYFS